jgi:transposase-like protein
MSDKQVRAQYTREYKLEAVRQVKGGQSIAATAKLIWLALRNITEDWGRAANNWKSAMNQFAILYEDRFTKSST